MEWQQVLWALVTLVGIAACWDTFGRRARGVSAPVEARVSALEAYQRANGSVLTRIEERSTAFESAGRKLEALALSQAAMAETLKQHEKAILDAKNTASKQVQNRWRS